MSTTTTSTNYLIPVGKKDEERMGSINYTFDPYSLKFSVPETITQKMNYLDVGCGPGVLTIGIAKKLAENGNVVAIDSSPEQIDVAKKNADQQNVTNIEWKVGNIYDLTKYKEQFDVVHCRFILCHLKDPVSAIEQLSFALKPGGLLVMEELTGNSFGWEPRETLALKAFRWMVNLQHFLQRSDITIGSKLAKIIKEQGYHYVEESRPDPKAATPEGKGLFPLAVRALALKLPSIFLRIIQPWISSLQQIQNDNDYSVTFRTFIQVRGIKPKE